MDRYHIYPLILQTDSNDMRPLIMLDRIADPTANGMTSSQSQSQPSTSQQQDDSQRLAKKPKKAGRPQFVFNQWAGSLRSKNK